MTRLDGKKSETAGIKKAPSPNPENSVSAEARRAVAPTTTYGMRPFYHRPRGEGCERRL